MSHKMSFLEDLGLLPVEVSRSHTPHSVGLLWAGEWPVEETSNTQHSQEVDLHTWSGIRTLSPSKVATTVPRLSSCGHQDRSGPN
jgi:hypothetical protein